MTTLLSRATSKNRFPHQPRCDNRLCENFPDRLTNETIANVGNTSIVSRPLSSTECSIGEHAGESRLKLGVIDEVGVVGQATTEAAARKMTRSNASSFMVVSATGVLEKRQVQVVEVGCAEVGGDRGGP